MKSGYSGLSARPKRLFAAGLLVAATVTAGPLAASGQAAPPVNPADYQQITLAKGEPEMGEPMSMTVLPDRTVLHTARNGTIRATDAAGNTRIIGTIPVYSHDEEGMQGIAADPGFATNRFVYVFYAPPLSTPAGDAPMNGTAADFAPFNGVNRLARYTLNSDLTINMASARTILDVPTSRGLCCHVGGDIDFDAAGNLYLTTGDDSNPFVDGYAPLDDRPSRNPAVDAQRSSANSNDLRGKLLRIKVNADGGYSIPAGNMFPPGTANTRPEIYAMGFRNPFRMNVDKATGTVYLGDYGPDAGTTTNRGPSGQVEFNRITGPGFFGWPYCTGSNTATETYAQYNYDTGAVGAKFNCGGAVNNSRNNTGIRTLPPAQPAWIKYAGDSGSPPEFGGGSESPMGAPVYRFDPNLQSAVKFPQSLDGHVFATEFGRRWIKDIEVLPNGTRGTIQPFPWTGTQIMDAQFGPDGALYILDYGTGWFNGDANSAVYRIEHRPSGSRPPVAAAGANRTSGAAPLTVNFSSAGSSDPDGGPLAYRWTFGDGATSTAANPSHTYTANGTYTAQVTVTDNQNLTANASVIINVGNTAPTVTVELPANGQVFNFGDTVPFRIRVTDPEDGTIDCNRVKMTYILGHDSHGHAITSQNGCTGSIATPLDGEHDTSANLFGVWDAEYTDNGANGQPPITTHSQSVTQPRTRQAEHFKAMQGVGVIDKAAANGGKTIGNIENGDWVSFDPYVLQGVPNFTARVSSGGAGGQLQVRAGSQTGALLGAATVPNTGGWETFVTVTANLSNAPAGTTKLFLVFTGGAGALFDVDEFTLGGSGTPQPGLLSAGRPATASSSESATYGPGNVTDGNATTRWSSQFADPQWLSIDLGQARSVSRVRLNWEAAYGRAYRIETSSDGTVWNSVYSTTASDGGIDDVSFTATNARYVRVHGIARATAWGYSLWEMEVYGA
ncbi:carbohydrate-binding protein [Kibdelosporangium persicum]|uniref:Secreted glycosyl hydrolase n=1 Tax=Kibdelosporangium persicum TaxID=2698649 RepID=A0ABX2F9R5_9PSEU|nr:carbohydrate-binding protein [Kibdelosporangium persicum]NRN67530.1 Secreted glycosyl hydrolase [Kibdelosporangium persicum]